MKELKWSCFITRIPRQDAGQNGMVLFHSVNRGVYYIPDALLQKVDAYLARLEQPSDDVKDMIAKLFLAEMLVEKERDESLLTDHMREEYYRQSKRSVFYFVPTMQCNFNCPYCIQHNTVHDQNSDHGKTMTIETARQSGRFMTEYSKRQAAKELLICFYGGEPLMAPEIGLTMMQSVKEHLEPDMTADYILITNGTLIREDILKQMQGYGLSTVQITLDGPPEIHNNRRTYVSGKPSFHIIIENVKKLNQWGFRITIRVNIDSTNAESITQLIDLLAEQGIAQYAEIKYAPVDSWESGSSEVGHKKDSLRWFMDIYKRTAEKGFYTTFWESLCGVYGKAFFSIAPDGGLYKCPSYTDLKAETVGDIFNGVNAHYYDFTQRDVAPACKVCRWMGVCGGGCLYQKFLISSDYNADYCAYQTFELIMEAYFKNTYQQKVQSYVNKNVWI